MGNLRKCQCASPQHRRQNTYILTVWFLLADGGEGCKVSMGGPLQQGQAHQTISRFGASSLTSQRRLIPIKV